MTETDDRQSKTQTIEATGKGWKAAQLLGGLATVAGIVGCVLLYGKPPIAVAALIVAALGFVVYLVGKIGAWWYHG